MTPTAIITDSTANIGPDAAAEFQQRLGSRFAIVDLHVTIGEDTRLDRSWSAAEVCAGMAAGATVSTSQAAVAQFSAAIAAVRDAGAEAVVVLTMSSHLSGTHSSAVQASAEAAIPVHVVDTGVTSASLAGAVAVAVAGAEKQVDASAIAAETADWAAEESRIFFMPESLEHLRRGGRIGAAASLVGRALAITPVLSLRDGVVAPLARVRTRARAVDRIVSLVSESAFEFSEMYPERGQEIVVLHAEPTMDEASDTARRLAAAVQDAALPTGIVFRHEVLSTVVTAHVGPGSTGIVVQTTP